MYPRSLGSNFVPRSPRVGLRVIHASAVPGALHAVPGDDLDEAARPYVADFDELAVEEENVWWMPGDPLRCAFPLNYTCVTAWVTVIVDI